MKQALRVASLVLCGVMTTAATPPDAAIRRILAERVNHADNVGIVVGLVNGNGRRIVAYGPFDGDSVFEIGSVTKVFTALLLTDMVQRGEVALDDPVAKYLPAGVTIPRRNGRAITLADLATHTSGLPFMTDQPLYPFLGRYQLTRDVGSDWEYSNIGYRLLGEALASRGGSDFESMLRTRILTPLHLNSTAINVSPKLRARLAPGHDSSLQPAPPVLSSPLYATMAAAGGLVSTANDLCTFLAWMMRGDHARGMLSVRRPISADREQALGWVIDHGLIFHDGGTLGYASAVAWDPVRHIGVVVLENQVGDVSDIARHLLRPDVPLAKPATTVRHTEIALDPAVLKAYAGRYDAPGEGVFTIAFDGGALTIEAPADWGLPKLRLRPESDHDFFVSELPLRVSFESGGRMLVYPPRGQKAVSGTKIAGSGILN